MYALFLFFFFFFLHNDTLAAVDRSEVCGRRGKTICKTLPQRRAITLSRDHFITKARATLRRSRGLQ